MPSTKIFYGSTYSSTSYGGIEIKGHGDTAKVTFTDNDKNETTAEIKAYTLGKLKGLKAFKRCNEVEDVELVNTWHLKQDGDTLMIYSNKHELAFALTCQQDLMANYKKLFVRGFLHHGFFNEMRLAAYFKSEHELEMGEVKAMSGMSYERLKLLANDIYGFEKLIQKGITLEDIGRIELKTLKKFLGASLGLDNALHFVTMNQILGLSHTPPRLSKVKFKEDNRYTFLGGWGSGSSGPFSYEHDSHSVKITHKDPETQSETHYEITFGELKEEFIEKYDTVFEDATPNPLVHDWYVGSSAKDAAFRVLYCKDTKQTATEKWDEAFPLNEVREGFQSYMLASAPFYQELRFAKRLDDFQTSIGDLRKLEGMSQLKLELIYKHWYSVEKLFKEHSIRFADLARVKTKRLEHVLTHFSDAESALKFVSAHELLGLNKHKPASTLGFFSDSARNSNDAEAPEASSDDEDTHVHAERSCVVM